MRAETVTQSAPVCHLRRAGNCSRLHTCAGRLRRWWIHTTNCARSASATQKIEIT